MTNTQSLGTIEATNPVLAVAPLKEETEMLWATDKITALYCRLSVEDMKEDKKGGKEDVSNSIQNQKMILLQYAKENRFPNPTFFVDDGYSGTNYDRPGFQAMLAEIEAGRVAVCITKDLSRLGRNSSLTGLYINFTFPKYNVRYIAINDHFDTIDPNSTDSDIAGIKNWFNEFFAKDTSRKIRAVVLEDLVWMHMKAVIFYVTRYENHFRAVMEHKLLLSSEEKICASVKRLEQAQRRTGELDRLFIRIYEDNVAGRINDERFSMMSRSYETEQAQLKEEIQTLQQEIKVQERQIENLEQFIQRVRKSEDLDELTPYALRELVKAIYIEAPDKSSGKRYQGIRISYDLVGFIPVEELLKQETA